MFINPNAKKPSESGYTAIRETISAMDETALADFICSISFIPVSAVPAQCRTVEFAYAWYRYISFRQNVYSETPDAETCTAQLLLLADEPTEASRLEVMNTAIRNRWKGLVPSCGTKSGLTRKVLRTSRKQREGARVRDTVHRRISVVGAE